MARLYFSNETADVANYKTLYVNTRRPGTTALTLASTAATEANQLTISGTAAAWITKPAAAAFTINSGVVLNLWALEGSAATNASITFELYKYSAGSEGSAFYSKTNGLTELGTTMTRVVYVSTAGTLTNFAAGDRLVVKLFNIGGGGTIGGAGLHTNFDFDGPDEDADGDSFIDVNAVIRVNERQAAGGATAMMPGVGQGYFQDVLERLDVMVKAAVVASNTTMQALMDDLGYERNNK